MIVLAGALAACQTVSTGTPTVAPTPALPTPRPTLTPRATQTFAPATLPAPREAQPTPTPIVYRVQPGDTLIPIANKFGVSVQDLIAANNNLDPTRLQIDQELIIPSAQRQPVATRALLPSPTPMPFQVRGLNVYRTPAGSLEVLGEVVNPGQSPIGNVQLLVTLSDAGGKALLTQPFFVALEVIPAGGTSPFRVLFTDPPQTYANFGITILRGENFATNTRYARVRVTGSEGRPQGNVFRVTGDVQNSDTAPARLVRVIVTAYDAERKVVGYRYQELNNDAALAPGGTLAFEVNLLASAPNVASYGVAAEALK